MGDSMYSKVDKYVQKFCKDSLNALKKEDKILKENFEKTKCKRFYSQFPKGLYLRSITEPILKYIIIKELVKKYKMWPEAGWFYRDNSILDLGISSPHNPEKNDDEAVDIAIEMKWGGMDKNGSLFSWSHDSLYKDSIKMIENCKIENKYFMQFIVLQDNEVDINITNLRKEVNSKIDRIKVRPIFCDFFETQGFEPNQYWRFYIITWKVNY